MNAPLTHILPLTTIRRRRLLPVPGKLLVRKGQKVGPNDVLAEAVVAPEHTLIDVARSLGISSAKADSLIHVRPDTQVAPGDLIAGPVGLTRRAVRATKAGRVVQVVGGQVLIQVQSPPWELKAGLSGEVIELIGSRGVVVEGHGALVQGVWGNNQLDYGLLTVLASAPGQELSPTQLEVSHRGAVIMGGMCQDARLFKVAADLPLRGLIMGSLAAGLIQAAERCPVPVVVLEGFGRLPLNPLAFKLLASSERREVVVNASAWNPHSGVRPEVVIALPVEPVPPLPAETAEFSAGQTVRVIGAARFGRLGVIETLSPPGEAMQFPSGVRAPGARLRLDDGEMLSLPLANLEVISSAAG